MSRPEKVQVVQCSHFLVCDKIVLNPLHSLTQNSMSTRMTAAYVLPHGQGQATLQVFIRAYLNVEGSIRAALAGWAGGQYAESSTNCSGGRISGGTSTSSLHEAAAKLFDKCFTVATQLLYFRTYEESEQPEQNIDGVTMITSCLR